MKITITSIDHQLIGDPPTVYDHFRCDAIDFVPLRIKIQTDLKHYKIEPPLTGISSRMIIALIRANIKRKDSDRLILPATGGRQASVENLLGRIEEAQGRSPRSVKLLSSSLAGLAIKDLLINYPYGICPYCGCPIEHPGLDSSCCVSCRWLPVQPEYRYK